MRILKKILFTILGLIALLLIIAIFVPRTYTVSVSETINTSSTEVFEYVKIIKNQENYSVWVMEDPKAKKVYSGTDGTVGFTSSWNSKNENVGEGSQTITKVIPNKRIDVDLHFIRPFEGDQKASTILKSIGNDKTIVTSEFYGNAPYPMNIMSFMMKGMLGDQMSKNLKNLKDILEK